MFSSVIKKCRHLIDCYFHSICESFNSNIFLVHLLFIKCSSLKCLTYKMLKWTLSSMDVYVNLVLHLFMNKVLPVTYSYWKSAFWFHCSTLPRTCSSGQPSSCRMCLPTSSGFDLVVRVPSWLDSVFWLFEVERFLGRVRKGEWYSVASFLPNNQGHRTHR